MMRMTASDAACWLKERDEFLIVTHRRPDGDTLCSAAALLTGLRAVGKTAWLYPNPEITEKFVPFLSGMLAPEGWNGDFIVSVDTASEGQFPSAARNLAEKTQLSIDHHISNTGYAENVCCVPEKAACGEIIYDVLQELGCEITSDIAQLLYIAVSTDTGCFAYANTNADTLRCAAALVEAGADNARINKVFFRTKPASRIALEGEMLSGLETWFDGKVCVAAITQDMLRRTGATENDMDDVAAIPGQLEGALAGILIKELPDGTVKVSVRSVTGTDSNALCTRFGGGGHTLASGCSIAMPLGEAKRELKKAMEEIWGF